MGWCLCLNDTEKAYELWASKFTTLLDCYAPIKKKRVRKKPSPWMKKHILDSIRKRDKLKNIARKSKLECDWVQYKKMRNSVTSLIRKAKRNYITESILQNKGNSGAMWKLLKFLIPDKKTVLNIQKLVYNGVEFTGNRPIADAFNEYFFSDRRIL